MRKEIEQYIHETYDVLQEYPWTDDPKSTTFKHRDNHKWFALIMEVPWKSLHMDKVGKVDAINLKHFPEMIGGLRKEPGILPAYHMNKEHWVTVLLDGTVAKQKICDLINISYSLTMKKVKK